MLRLPGVMHELRRVALVACLTALIASASMQPRAQGTTIYVDGTIASASCATYAPAARSCGGGSATAYRTLAGAVSAAAAGTTVLVRGGTFQEQLNLTRSGTAAQPIVFAAYQGETPTISNVSVGIQIAQREYIEIDGLTVTDVTGWARLEDARHITIRNSVFRRATSSGTTGSVKLVRSSDNRLIANVLDSGTDNMVLVDNADRNLVQGNTFSTGRHSLLSVRCSNFNIFRGNSFANPSQKAAEIYDCEGGSDAPFRLDATKYNLFDGNQFTKTLATDADHRYNAIQHAGQHTIVRRNVFRHNDGGGVNYQQYSDEAIHVYGNRMYNNTFYENRCYAIIGDNGDSRYYDQQVKNNIVYRNMSCSGGSQQTNIRNTSQVVLTNNSILTTSPGFVDEAGYDFHLAAGSPMIDAGAAPTTATAAGSGTSLRVQDARWFFDGFGIPGEVGDVIQLAGQVAVATVVDIDYATNTLTLDRPLAWSAGQGVSLRYAGAAMDQGAFEYGLGGGAPRPPTNVRVTSQ